nr:hypothetical protein [uncultured Celeribacter sp.]
MRTLSHRVNAKLLFATLLLSACTQMDQYFDGKTVNVDGEEFLVRRLSSGSYQAMPNNPNKRFWGWTVDAAAWGKNYKAIEIATGCKIIPGTVKNDNSHSSIAAVDCTNPT